MNNELTHESAELSNLKSSLGRVLAEEHIMHMIQCEAKKLTNNYVNLNGYIVPEAIIINADSEDKDDITYLHISKATLPQLKAYLEHLSKQIRADTARLNAVGKLSRLMQGLKAEDDATVETTLNKIEQEQCA